MFASLSIIEVINRLWLVVTFLIATFVSYRVVFKDKKIKPNHFLALLVGFLVFAISEIVEFYYILGGAHSPFKDVFLTVIGFLFVFAYLGGFRK